MQPLYEAICVKAPRAVHTGSPTDSAIERKLSRPARRFYTETG